jgi:hypothetical protein
VGDKHYGPVSLMLVVACLHMEGGTLLKVCHNGVSHCNKPDTVDSTDGLSATLRIQSIIEQAIPIDQAFPMMTLGPMTCPNMEGHAVRFCTCGHVDLLLAQLDNLYVHSFVMVMPVVA